jgi:PAT family beta-lactamase induction signal transducer AmpG
MTELAGGTRSWSDAVKPYVQKEPLAAFFLGVSSGFPYAMIGATLTTRLAQDGIDKKAVTAFTLAFLVYNLKWLWAWMVDGVRLPIIGRLGQRVSWLLLTGLLVMAAVANLALVDPTTGLLQTAYAAILVGAAGATFDIVIDAYRIETLKPEQLGVGSGMSQYGWRIGSVAAGALALVLAARIGWHGAYLACAVFALPAMLTGLVLGEPERHREAAARRGMGEVWQSIAGPLVEFFRRRGAVLVLCFILLHKIGDTLANLTFRLLFDDMGYSNDEIAIYDVGIGFWAYLIGIFVGGILYARLGMKRSVLISLVLMCVSNFSFAALAALGKSNWGMAGAIGFENFASGIGGDCGWRQGEWKRRMIFLVASICIQIICAVDVVRSGRNQIWMLFIFLFSLAGCFAYLMLEVLPAYWGNRHLRTARSQVVGKVDPERGLRKARDDLDLAETAANRIALGDALLDLGRFAEAEAAYRKGLALGPGQDATTQVKLAQTLFELGRSREGLAELDDVPDVGRGSEWDRRALLRARMLADIGEDAQARLLFEDVMSRYAGEEARCHYAAFLLEQGDRLRAREILEEV